MEYRLLGRSGVRIAPLALGTQNFGAPTAYDDADRMINIALDRGINLIDTSNSYNKGESERIIGRSLAGSGRRHETLIATKAHYPTGPGPNDRGNSRLHLIRACEDSLKRLQTDYIDLFQLHRPSPEIPIEETLGALTDLVRAGKIRYVGTSTMPAWAQMEAIMMSELKGLVRPVSEQPPYNLLDRRIENETVPFAQKYGVGLITWSPLAMGILIGRYSDAKNYPADSRAKLVGSIYADRVTERGIEVGNRFVELAQRFGMTPAQLGVLWVKEQPGITAPLIGPKSVEQLELLLPVLEMSLPEEVRSACDELVSPGSVAANFHNTAPWMRMKIA
ncbi:MAG: aldo/keto reductase [Chloroflexota bacterium]